MPARSPLAGHLPWVAAILLAACGAPRELRLDLPISAGDRSVVLAVAAVDEDGSPSPRWFAAEVDEAGRIDPILLPIELARPVDVVVALYSEPLDVLFLDPGELHAPSPGQPSRGLPAPRSVQRTTAMAGEAPRWSIGEVSDVALSAARLPALPDCVPLEGRAFALPTSRKALFAVSARATHTPPGLPGPGFLVGTEGRKLYWVESSTVVELQPTVAGPCGGDDSGIPQFYDAYAEPSGTVWLTSRCGELHAVTVDLGGAKLVGGVAESTQHRDAVVAIDGPATGEVRVFFTTSDSGQVERHDLTTSLSTILTAAGTRGEGEVAYVSDEDTLFAWTGLPSLLSTGLSGDREEVLPGLGERARPVSVSRAGALGFVAGTTGGATFFRRRAAWSPLGAEPGRRVLSIAPFRGSVLILNDAGRLSQYSPARSELCEPLDVAPTAPARALRVAAGETAAIVIGEGGEYRWLTAAE